MCFVRSVLILPFRSPGLVFCLKGIPSDHFSLRFHLQICIYTYPYYPTRLCTTQYPNDHFLTMLTIKWPVFTICKCLALCIPFGCLYGCPFKCTYTIDPIQRNIFSFPYHPHYCSHTMQGMYALAMLVMHKNAQNASNAKYGYAMLFTYLL